MSLIFTSARLRNTVEMRGVLMDDKTFDWMVGLSDAELVEVLFRAGRINYDDKDYWLKLIPALRAPRP